MIPSLEDRLHGDAQRLHAHCGSARPHTDLVARHRVRCRRRRLARLSFASVGLLLVAFAAQALLVEDAPPKEPRIAPTVAQRPKPNRPSDPARTAAAEPAVCAEPIIIYVPPTVRTIPWEQLSPAHQQAARLVLGLDEEPSDEPL